MSSPVFVTMIVELTSLTIRAKDVIAWARPDVRSGHHTGCMPTGVLSQALSGRISIVYATGQFLAGIVRAPSTEVYAIRYAGDGER